MSNSNEMLSSRYTAASPSFARGPIESAVYALKSMCDVWPYMSFQTDNELMAIANSPLMRYKANIMQIGVVQDLRDALTNYADLSLCSVLLSTCTTNALLHPKSAASTAEEGKLRSRINELTQRVPTRDEFKRLVIGFLECADEYLEHHIHIKYSYEEETEHWADDDWADDDDDE